MYTQDTMYTRDQVPAVYADVTGLRLLDSMRALGKRIFTTFDAQEMAARLEIPPTTLTWVLTQLVKSGRLTHLRRGLYAIDDSRSGGPAPHPFAIATALVAPSVISHWSAMAYHGLTEQIPRIITATTTRDIVTPRMRRGATSDGPASLWEVPGLSIRYVRVQPHHFWGFQEVWVDETARIPITDRERTVLDGFVSPAIFGSIHEVLGVLEEHLTEIDIDKLVAYALRYGRGSVIKRLGYFLEQFDVPSSILEPLRDAPITSHRLLDPDGLDRGPYLARWRVRDNMTPG